MRMISIDAITGHALIGAIGCSFAIVIGFIAYRHIYIPDQQRGLLPITWANSLLFLLHCSIYLIGLSGLLTHFMLIEISSVLGAVIALGFVLMTAEALWFEALLYRTKPNTLPHRAFETAQNSTQPLIVSMTLVSIVSAFVISYFIPDWTIVLMVLVLTIFWGGIYAVAVRPILVGAIVDKYLS